MKLKLLRDAMLSNDDKKATPAGAVVEVSPAQGRHMLDNGIAEKARADDIAKAEPAATGKK